MNERIKELADQVLPNEKEFHKGDPKNWGYFFSGEELEKFAELIVRECADLCDRFQSRNVGMQPAECAGAIRKMFGIEE